METFLQEENKISYQVIRVQKFTKKDLVGIGRETERTTRHNRNEDIDENRTPLNFYYKRTEHGFSNAWKNLIQSTGANFKETKKSTAFEGIIITSDKTFFERLGYVQGEQPPQEVMRFFDAAYRFVLHKIGYHGTDQNILSAVVHFDETTPHLQLYYLPLVNIGQKKVYAKDKDGKVLRNEKGSPVQAKDKFGKSIYETVLLETPKLCSSDFWAERGSQLSFGNLQDDFYDQVSYRFGLERGEVGSNKKHTTKYQWETERKKKELSALDKQKEALSEELMPLKQYIDAFHDAIDGKKPFFKGQLEKQIVGLTAEYKRLETEKKIQDKDRTALFDMLQKAEKQIPELNKYKDFVRLLADYAPNELSQAKQVAYERKDNKFKSQKTHFNNFGNFR